MVIHQTLSDKGDLYYTVPQWIFHTVVILICLILCTLFVITYILVGYKDKFAELDKFTEVTIERRKAFDEMLTNRASVQQWTFNQACLFAKSRGDKCLDNPEWWADPKKYPLLMGDDKAGSGLFPDTSHAIAPTPK